MRPFCPPAFRCSSPRRHPPNADTGPHGNARRAGGKDRAGQTHCARAGETLGAIALQYDVTVEDIQAANSLDGFLIGIGDELTIPIVRTNTSGSNASGPQQDFLYTVESGDTLIGIAPLKFGRYATDSILQANGLAANALIIPGDQLIVPVANVPPEALTIEVPAAGAAATRPAPVKYMRSRSWSIRLTTPRSHAASRCSCSGCGVDLLQPNEWYVLQLFPRTLDSNRIPHSVDQTDELPAGNGARPGRGYGSRIQLADFGGACQPGRNRGSRCLKQPARPAKCAPSPGADSLLPHFQPSGGLNGNPAATCEHSPPARIGCGCPATFMVIYWGSQNTAAQNPRQHCGHLVCPGRSDGNPSL